MRGAESLNATLPSKLDSDREPCVEFLRTLCHTEIQDDGKFKDHRLFRVTLKYGQNKEGGQSMPPYREIYFKLDLQVALMILRRRRVAARYDDGTCNVLSGARCPIVTHRQARSGMACELNLYAVEDAGNAPKALARIDILDDICETSCCDESGTVRVELSAAWRTRNAGINEITIKRGKESDGEWALLKVE